MSPAVTYQSIYLWFYAAINFGSCGAISASFLARDHGYWAAFLVPTAIFVLVPIVMVLGKNVYIKTPPRGSILLEVRSMCHLYNFFLLRCDDRQCASPLLRFPVYGQSTLSRHIEASRRLTSGIPLSHVSNNSSLSQRSVVNVVV